MKTKGLRDSPFNVYDPKTKLNVEEAFNQAIELLLKLVLEDYTTPDGAGYAPGKGTAPRSRAILILVFLDTLLLIHSCIATTWPSIFSC